MPADETYGAAGTETPEGLYVLQNTGLAAVIPAWKISDLIWGEELTEMRDEDWEARKRETAGGPPNATDDPTDKSS